jgi:serine 3-dehydrogenase
MPSDRDGCVVVIGGTGFVGRRVVAGLLRRGFQVVVPARSEVRAGELAEHLAATGVDGRAGELAIAVESETTSADDEMARRGWTAEHAVACIGGWWKATTLLETELSVFRDLMDSHLTAHFRALARWAPILRGDRPTYIALNGVAGERPVAFSGPVSVAGAAQRRLIEVASVEGWPPGVRFRELCLLDPVAGDERNEDNGDPEIAEDALLDALVGLMRDQGPFTDVVARISGQGSRPRA